MLANQGLILDEINSAPWRLVQNEWNRRGAPWTGAIGVEVDTDLYSVPSVICWFTRGWNSERAAREMIERHNASLKAHEPKHSE